MTLPASAALLLSMPAAGMWCRRIPNIYLLHISCPQGTQQQTRWLPLLLSIDGADRWTDTCSPAYYFRQHQKRLKLKGNKQLM